jgi:triphosphoribosyl-dephospho-CoA synthase
MLDAISPPHSTPPLTIGACAALACIWEATAPKPGNVYRGADFDDLTYADFLTSATMIGPVLEHAAEAGVGTAVLDGVRATRAAVSTNSNLGILLLLAPLAAVSPGQRLAAGIPAVLEALSAEDTRQVYAAIQVAQPGGLGEAPEADVNVGETPTLGLKEVMRLAQHRDLVARQYVDNFAEVFWTAERIAAAVVCRPLGQAIVYGYLELLAKHPDSLIGRKLGEDMAREASTRAAAALGALADGEAAYQEAVGHFDFWLRADGHRRNPGTSADMVAAALFVLLRERRLDWPVRFY